MQNSSDLDSHLALHPHEWARRAIAQQPWQPLRDRVVERCTEEVFGSERLDRSFMEALAGSVEENVQALHQVLVGELELGDVPLVNRLRFASLQTEARVPQAAFQRAYRISFFLQWQEWSRVIAAAAEAHDVERDEAVLVMQSLTALVLAYADRVVSSLALSFARSEEAMNRSRVHIRQRLIREILDGAGDTLSPADLVPLDYPLDAWHVAVRLPAVSVSGSNQLVAGLRAAVHHQHSIAYPLSLDSCVVWLGAIKPWSEQRLELMVSALKETGATASVSDPKQGLDGFLDVYNQVRQVEATRSAQPDGEAPPVLRYSRLRLEILLLQNPDLAADFVRHELGPLAEDSPEAAKLRTTLTASFRLGSHVATADHLRLHEHTVRNRLQKAQEILGPLHVRRTEIQVALRLWRVLDKG